jgi:hypothetical protein
MKLSVTKETVARATAALLRNCLTRHHAPRACPVRKCRRDGLCSGPLFTAADGDGCRLARPDAADVAPGRNAAPICYLHIPKPLRIRVDKALATAVRKVVATPGLEIAEATRTITSRRWRRLKGIAG